MYIEATTIQQQRLQNMFKFSAIVLSIFFPIQATAQAANEAALESSMRELASTLRKASRNEIYLIDEVGSTCRRVTSGLKQRNAIYFKTASNTEASEVFLDGTGTYRFNVEASAAGTCQISRDVKFELIGFDGTIWAARLASGYCIKTLVLLDNCSQTCHEYADIGERQLFFVAGKKEADDLISAKGGESCVNK